MKLAAPLPAAPLYAALAFAALAAPASAATQTTTQTTTQATTQATLSRTVEVKGSPKAVWAMIGSFCSIKDWHPAIGACTENGKSPPTRTLVTKDGKATFVEKEVARSAARHSYSYAIESSPLPITHYVSTLKVTAAGAGLSKITWSSAYTPDAGQTKAAADALIGVYESGLAGIKGKLGG